MKYIYSNCQSIFTIIVWPTFFKIRVALMNFRANQYMKIASWKLRKI